MLVPITNVPDGARLIGVLATVIPGVPGASVVPWILNPEGLAVKVSLPMVKTDDDGLGVGVMRL